MRPMQDQRPRRWSLARAKELKLKQREVELKLLSEENLILTADLTTMPPDR